MSPMKTFFQKSDNTQVIFKWPEMLQKNWATSMSRLTIGLSKKSLVWGLFVFIGVTGFLSFLLIYKGITSGISDTIHVDRIRRPVKLFQIPVEHTVPETFQGLQKEKDPPSIDSLTKYGVAKEFYNRDP